MFCKEKKVNEEIILWHKVLGWLHSIRYTDWHTTSCLGRITSAGLVSWFFISHAIVLHHLRHVIPRKTIPGLV